jgi:hypothetical protein
MKKKKKRGAAVSFLSSTSCTRHYVLATLTLNHAGKMLRFHMMTWLEGDASDIHIGKGELSTLWRKTSPQDHYFFLSSRISLFGDIIQMYSHTYNLCSNPGYF